MANIKLEDLPVLVLADTTLLFGENTPYTTLADAGKFLLSSLDSRYNALYVLKVGDTMSGDLDLGDSLLTSVGHVAFNLAHAGAAGIGQLQWNNDDGTLEVGALGGSVVLQVGQENHARVVQKTGSTIMNGKSITIVGASGQRAEVALTDIAAGPPLDTSGGLTTEAIDNNQEGYVTTFGLVRGLDTSAWAEGAFIWADPATAGDLIDVRPTAPDRAVFIGTVVRSHATLGSIFVTPIIVQNLSLLSDVLATSLSDKDELRWVAASSRWESFSPLPQIKSQTVTTQGLGANPDIFAFGFYEFSASDANLSQASATQTFGSANVSYAAHAFAVAGGPGSTDAGVVGLRVNGVSITDAGVRTPGDTEIISSDITTLSPNDFLESPKKWLGQITFELFVVSGVPTVYSLDINYGLAKYDDWSNRDFTITSVEVVGFAGSNDSAFDIQLVHHRATNWTYSAAAFNPITASRVVASLVGDHSTDDQLVSSGHFAWKRVNLSQAVVGSGSEGFLFLISSSTNNAVEYCNIHVGVEV